MVLVVPPQIRSSGPCGPSSRSRQLSSWFLLTLAAVVLLTIAAVVVVVLPHNRGNGPRCSFLLTMAALILKWLDVAESRQVGLYLLQWLDVAGSRKVGR